MAQFIICRVLWMLVVLTVVSVITFFLMHAVPGGPFSKEKPLPPQVIENLNKKYRLDEPLVNQYVGYMADILIPHRHDGERTPLGLKRLSHQHSAAIHQR